MEAKQVWRAALGELQVSLSPANFETWLKDTELVEIDENRYRISAPTASPGIGSITDTGP